MSPLKIGQPGRTRPRRTRPAPQARGNPDAAEPGRRTFPIVGIGASAGALAALKKFFAQVPAESGLAYVVVVHLSPDRESHLQELLQPHVPMPVQQVRDTVAIEPDHVYVIPPNANLDTIDTHLRLTDLEGRRQERAPIDHFFRTLADTHDGDAVAVVLTGTGSDGTQGLRQIKARGGLTIVQDPDDAEYDGMPRSAIIGAPVDLVLPLDQIPDAILRFVRTEPRVDIPADEEGESERAGQFLQKVFVQIRARTGRDFSGYKRSTLLRRITRRMQVHQMREPADYVALLRQNPEEARVLADDLLVTVTSFFRDRAVFEQLEQAIVPRLFAGKSVQDPLRVWIVGCATGEEAYSFAIVLLEEAARRGESPLIQVFASDLHPHSLEKAREGFYPGDIETDVRPELLHRYFRKENGGYRVRKEVRELVIFAPHNLLGDPPFSRLDLISCRNLLIYLRRELQQQVTELFHYALVPDGVLLLGTSESVDTRELFHVEDKKHAIFTKRNVPPREPRLPVFPLTRPSVAGGRHRIELPSEPLAYGPLHHRLIERHGPPSVLVSPDDQAVHLSAHAGRYLVHPGGTPTTSIHKLVRPELRVELRAALGAARNQKGAFRTRPTPVRFDGEPASVILDARPATEPGQDGFVLLIFDERPAGEPAGEHPAPSEGPDAERMHDLEAGKRLADQRLQAIVEEYETSQEELKASNEELQSANEELRSTLEELETSKEELQSTNEELQTVNQENRHRVEELAQLTTDLQNLLAATDIATLFLDRSLRILRFTPRVSEHFNVLANDRGRPISDITSRLGYESLREDATRVLDRLVPVEREIQDPGGRWYLTRILPYRAGDDRIAGIVITFVDITSSKANERELRESEARHRALAELSPEAIVVSAGGRCVYANPAAAQLLAAGSPGDVVGRSHIEFFEPEHHEALRAREREILDDGRPMARLEYRWKRLDGSGVDVEVVAGPTDWAGAPALQLIARDVTERRRADHQLREANRQKDQYLAILGHELRNPLAAIRNAAQLVRHAETEEPEVRRAYGVLERQSAHMARIIDGLLEVSRIVRGRIDLRREVLDLRRIVRNVLDEQAAPIAALGLELASEEPAEPLWVDADEIRLVQVVDNLVGNATKFTPAPGTIGVRTERAGGQAVLRVRDSGIGIRREVLDRIFEAFQQGPQDVARSEGGLGLGLPLARGLVELHGGTLEANSEGQGAGAEFVVRLPLASPPVAPAEDDRPAPVVPPTRVLIVEDNADAAQMLGDLLTLSRHEVTTVGTATAALDALRARGTDVVLCDLGLPGMDGYELAREVRADPALAGVTLVALTGYGQPEDRARSAAAGFNEHLLKPVDLSTLDDLLRRLNAPDP